MAYSTSYVSYLSFSSYRTSSRTKPKSSISDKPAFQSKSDTRLWSSSFGLQVSSKRTVYQLDRTTLVYSGQTMNRAVVCSSSVGQDPSIEAEAKRKVVEHVCLLKARDDITDEQEKDMLDYLYTTQYQMRGILAVSVGRISEQNLENFTHAFFSRFQSKEDLKKFYENPFYLGVLKDYVFPYCHGSINIDYESEVEHDILAIFRKGEEFNYGVEFILLIEFVESAYGKPAEDALASLANLAVEFPSLVVQATQGMNFSLADNKFTHGMVIRFRSDEALQIFMSSSEYNHVWTSKFEPIARKVLSVCFSIDPVGTNIM